MQRYQTTYSIRSKLDPISDVLVLLEYLTSRDYLVDVLCSRHGLPRGEAIKRSLLISPHVNAALAFIRSSLASPPEISFLPSYYGILNLLKVYVLVGPYYAELPVQRWHGVSYPTTAKNSRTLLTEVVDLRAAGAIPLAHRTLTGQQISNRTRLSLSDIYPYVSGIGAEYFLATRSKNRIKSIAMQHVPLDDGSRFRLTARLNRQPGDTTSYNPRGFKVLKGFTRDSQDQDKFVGPALPASCGPDSNSYRSHFVHFLVYGFEPQGNLLFTPYSARRLLLPEELPIALLFFHMSSVVRYKPEFVARLRNSRFWPMLLAAQRHCVLRFLVLAWSFVHQQKLEVKSQ